MSASKKKQERRAAELAGAAGQLTEKQKRELQEAKAKKRNAILAAIGGVVVAVLVILLLVWHTGVFSRHTVALTVKDHNFSVSDMDYFYNQAINNAYAQDQQMAQLYAQIGQTYTSPIDFQGDFKTQYVDEDQTTTYHDQFQENAKSIAAEVAALYDAAQAEGYTLSEDAQTSIDEDMTSLDKQVKQSGYANRSAYLKALYGRGMSESVYKKNLEMYVLAYDYYSAKMDAIGDYTDEELEAYYNENADTLDSYTYNYLYIDGSVSSTTDEDGNTVEPTEEEKTAAMETAKENAETLMAAVRAAEEAGSTATPSDGSSENAEPSESDESSESAETPESSESSESPAGETDYFAQAAVEYTTSDTRRENVMGRNFSSATYATWLMDASRQDGDMEKFEVEDQGYYVIQFHSRERDDTPTADVRHILFSTAMEDDPDTADVDESQETPSDEYIAEIKAKAQDVLDQFNAGDKTADAFGELAEEYSDDSRDSETGDLSAPGGLYEKISPTDSYVQEWLDWIFEDGRQAGDTGLVQTSYGWHIMYYQGTNDPTWKTQAASDKKTADQESWIDGVQDGYDPVESSSFSQVGR